MRLPLLCRLRRHTWRPSPLIPGSYSRTTCRRCHHFGPDLYAPVRPGEVIIPLRSIKWGP